MVEKSASLRYTFHVALRIIFLIKYFISYTLLLVSLHLTMDEVKKHQNRVLAHITPNRETEINALWKGSFQMLKTQHKRKGLKGTK